MNYFPGLALNCHPPHLQEKLGLQVRATDNNTLFYGHKNMNSLQFLYIMNYYPFNFLSLPLWFFCFCFLWYWGLN
jgi:hypothetical protein